MPPSWVEAILGFLRQFWPFVIVYHFERGVRYWRGRIVGGNLEPDWYWCIPFFMHIETVPVKPDIMKLWKIALTTQDGVGLIISANVKYEVVDAMAAWNNVQDYKDNLADECRTHLSKRIRDLKYDELLADQPKLERSCKDTMTTAVKDYGVVILRVGITDFVKTRNFSLVNMN